MIKLIEIISFQFFLIYGWNSWNFEAITISRRIKMKALRSFEALLDENILLQNFFNGLVNRGT